jgi:DNA-binding NarL/FixJ family response regulator
MNLILVDDNLNFLEVLKFFVENKLDHRVIAEAKSGEDFLELKNICEAEVVLMDLIMEKTDGFEAAKLVQLRFPKIKILAMTMNTEKAIRCKLIETGFKGVILKTDMFSSLETILQAVCCDENVFHDGSKKSIS